MLNIQSINDLDNQNSRIQILESLNNVIDKYPERLLCIKNEITNRVNHVLEPIFTPHIFESCISKNGFSIEFVQEKKNHEINDFNFYFENIFDEDQSYRLSSIGKNHFFNKMLNTYGNTHLFLSDSGGDTNISAQEAYIILQSLINEQLIHATPDLLEKAKNESFYVKKVKEDASLMDIVRFIYSSSNFQISFLSEQPELKEKTLEYLENFINILKAEGESIKLNG